MRTVIVYGKPDERAPVHKHMPADWDMKTLRAEIARGYGWAGFGMVSAEELDATGEPTRTLSIGASP